MGPRPLKHEEIVATSKHFAILLCKIRYSLLVAPLEKIVLDPTGLRLNFFVEFLLIAVEYLKLMRKPETRLPR